MKNFVRSLIVVLSLLAMVVGCSSYGTSNDGKNETGKVIAEQYRGIYMRTPDSDAQVHKIEFTENKAIYTSAKNIVELTAWTVDNKLWNIGNTADSEEINEGYFEGSKYTQVQIYEGIPDVIYLKN